MAKRRSKNPERTYPGLTGVERNSIERMMNRGKSCRANARKMGSPSTVSDKVSRRNTEGSQARRVYASLSAILVVPGSLVNPKCS